MDSLFVYGTLAPGRANAYMLEGIGGTWEEGYVHGTLIHKGWGANLGYPGIVLGEEGNRVDGFIFYSENLNEYWDALDEFEGEEYSRVLIDVTTQAGHIVTSYIYEIKSEEN